MRTRKEMKKSAKHVLRRHYALLVITCLIIAFAGTEFSSSMTAVRNTETPEQGEEVSVSVTPYGSLNGAQIVQEALFSGTKQAERKADELEKKMIGESKRDGSSQVLGRSRGVLASVVNGVSSGSIFIKILALMNSISKSESITLLIFILLSAVGMGLIWFYFENLLGATMRRIFLEARIYEKVPVTKFLFFVRIKRWTRAAWTMLVTVLYQFFWTLTIVGGVIKHYSYRMVPFIVAENPSLKAKEAITLSRKMMNGHKWNCFVLDLSFVGWSILGMVTFGLVDILFVNPYKTATFAEYYAELRKQAIHKKIPGYEGFDDTYLFEKADQATLSAAYGDISELLKEHEQPVEFQKGILGLIADFFGVVLMNTPVEQRYEEYQIRDLKIKSHRDVIEGKCYPSRLFTIPEKEKQRKVETMRYLRHYSLWSIVLLFFSFAFIGWIWEVSLHLFAEGTFVNRGVLHGPWLPIYGTGGVLILLVLNKLRKYPVAEFFSAVVLCGIVEYFTAYSLEMSHGGQKWWDYSGYFLNLHGRICAEGLLVFGLGGVAIVYLLAPMLDNIFKKINRKILIPVCLILICVFSVDQAYSSKHPNTGKGITDYSLKIGAEKILKV